VATATGSPGWVKLLLDAHHSPRAAERLRQRGYDAVSATDDSALVTMDDEELLRHASVEDRALVTEDAKDFDRIVRAWATTGEHHAGVIFTSPRRFHRGSSSYPEDLVLALSRLLDSPPDDPRDWVHRLL
jgi:uncharacterized protein with PIN domain